ncbi:hypothetical protein FRC02_003159 [Tulasnella sp. 418]|nr:hypothetical protein FRC02_003159 [Tulasnella sp. 418]
MYGCNRSSYGSIVGRGFATRTLHLRSSLLPLIQSLNNLTLPPVLPHTSSGNQNSVTAPASSTHEYASEKLVPILFQEPVQGETLKRPLGFLRPMVLDSMLSEYGASNKPGGEIPWSFHTKQRSSLAQLEDVWAVSFSPRVQNKTHRTKMVSELVNKWRAEGRFPKILGGWSDEEYPVYLPSDAKPSDNDGHMLALSIERAALPLFGFPNFGTFLIGYCWSGTSSDLKIWVSRRSKTKKTFPGLMDVTAGGGIGIGESPLHSMAREASEEASLPSSYILNHARSTGCVTFSHRNPQGWLLPGLYYTYEMELPSDHSITPRTNAKDGEVDGFEFISAQECLERLSAGEFKPSSALAIVDFLARHGLYTPEMDPSYASVLLAIRRDLGVPVPR